MGITGRLRGSFDQHCIVNILAVSKLSDCKRWDLKAHIRSKFVFWQNGWDCDQSRVGTIPSLVSHKLDWEYQTAGTQINSSSDWTN